MTRKTTQLFGKVQYFPDFDADPLFFGLRNWEPKLDDSDLSKWDHFDYGPMDLALLSVIDPNRIHIPCSHLAKPNKSIGPDLEACNAISLLTLKTWPHWDYVTDCYELTNWDTFQECLKNGINPSSPPAKTTNPDLPIITEMQYGECSHEQKRQWFQSKPNVWLHWKAPFSSSRIKTNLIPLMERVQEDHDVRPSRIRFVYQWILRPIRRPWWKFF